MTERRKDRKTDRLKTVYPPKLRLRGYNKLRLRGGGGGGGGGVGGRGITTVDKN